jgi:hypothetical protein
MLSRGRGRPKADPRKAKPCNASSMNGIKMGRRGKSEETGLETGTSGSISPFFLSGQEFGGGDNT